MKRTTFAPHHLDRDDVALALFVRKRVAPRRMVLIPRDAADHQPPSVEDQVALVHHERAEPVGGAAHR